MYFEMYVVYCLNVQLASYFPTFTHGLALKRWTFIFCFFWSLHSTVHYLMVRKIHTHTFMHTHTLKLLFSGLKRAHFYLNLFPAVRRACFYILWNLLSRNLKIGCLNQHISMLIKTFKKGTHKYFGSRSTKKCLVHKFTPQKLKSITLWPH